MSEKRIVRRSLADRRPGRTDWARVDALGDAEIDAAIASDPDAVPVLDADWFATAERLMDEPEKQGVYLNLDRDVVDWFKAQGKGYQTRMNAVLRAFWLHARGRGVAGQPRGQG